MAQALAAGEVAARSAPSRREQFGAHHSASAPALGAPGSSCGPLGVRPLGGGWDAVRQVGTNGVDAARASLAAADWGAAAFEGSRTGRRGHSCRPGAAAARVPPDGHLRQRDGVRSPLRTPCPRHRDVLLRHLLAVAEGRRGERDWTNALEVASEDGTGPPLRGGVCSATPSVQQYASQVPRLPDFGRGPPRPGVALRM